jgi:hypothetical protein
MQYLVNGKKFEMSYKELREEYLKVCEYSPEEFLDKVSEILHLVCIIFYLKEVPTSVALADDGLIHELAHWIDNIEWVTSEAEVMSMFREQCKLA